MKNINRLRESTGIRAAGLFLLGGAVLTACGGSETKSEASSPGENSPATATTQTPTRGAAAQFKFNALGGGSSVIEVYPGTSTSAADKVGNGTYFAGDVRPIECHEEGRTVTSHPEAGEERRTSNDWYRLVGGPTIQYATGTYGDVVPPNAQIPEC